MLIQPYRGSGHWRGGVRGRGGGGGVLGGGVYNAPAATSTTLTTRELGERNQQKIVGRMKIEKI